MFLFVKFFLLAILLLRRFSSFHWEAAWFEVFTVSDGNLVLNFPSFCRKVVVMLHVRVMLTLLGTSMRLSPTIQRSSGIVRLISFSGLVLPTWEAGQRIGESL